MSLTPSQRVLLIKEITKRLSAEDWSLIDVTLKQFGLSWTNDWQGSDKYSYVIHMVQDGSDEALIDLGLHVGFQFDVRAPGMEPPFWQKGLFRVFLTHLSVHRGLAAELQEALTDFGISCFVAHNDIEPTSEWQNEIQAALATCDALIALLHQNFHSSWWTDQEIGFAMGRGVPVFSVRFDQDPYGFIGRFQAFDGNGKSAKALAEELFNSYRKNKQTQRRMAEGLVGLFEASYSFVRAKRLISHLEELEVWEPSFSPRLRSAVKDNLQVSGSWGVPERVNQLVKKWDKKGV